MSERGGREASGRRSSFRKSLSETSLPPQYLAQLEEKRKQLDESIHKYIASKEREYKVFERDLRQQHRTNLGHDASNGTSKRRSSPESISSDVTVTKLDSPRLSAVDTLLASPTKRPPAEAEEDAVSPQDRSTIAGLKDRRASLERERDFIGVFTPSYLPALGYQENSKLERTSSAPEAVQQSKNLEVQDQGGSLERANSDSVMQAKPRRPSHLALVQRTSSSGSSADGRLTSAMKNTQRPKRKQRVSLAVGDAIVAPSDSVPLSLSQNSTSSHSRIRSTVPDRELPISKKEVVGVREERRVSLDSSLEIAENVALANAIGADKDQLPEHLSQQATASILPENASRTIGNSKPSSATSRIDADGDLFDLEAEENDDDEAVTDEVIIPGDEDDLEDGIVGSGHEVTGRIDANPSSEGGEVIPGEEKYDPTTGLIPEKEGGTDSAVPYLAFGPSSAVASQQPINPGFRRPSVTYDPIYHGDNYNAAERDAVENEIYGSSFNRPSIKSSFTAGSLGESYMAQHAEEMMKLRASRQQAQVRS